MAEQTVGEQGTGEIEDFSLVLGGPVYQFMLRLKLIEPPLRHVGLRIIAITAFAWLPLVALTIFDGRFAGNVKVPLLHDFEANARLLFALPLLIIAELLVYLRMRSLTANFIQRHIVTDAVRPAFTDIIASAVRLRNSLVAEIVLLVAVFLIGPHIWRGPLDLRSTTWYATSSSSGSNYNAAGYWYAFVSIPIFQFLLLRWYYRIVIWCRFLFQVSRLDLNLLALHPDCACGLGFLGGAALSFAPLLMAHSGIVAGYIANRILQEGATLPDYKRELIGLAVLMFGIALGPLCVFMPKLYNARLAGLRAYGVLASEYVIGFARKWTGGANPNREPLLGSPDLQSLADLANGFEVVKRVKLVPFGKDIIIGLLVVIALPLLPLALTMFSAEELFKRLISVLL